MGVDKRTPTEAHIRVTLKILNSPAYIALDYSAKALYMDLRSRLRTSNNGNINAALTELRHRGWRSPSTLAKALRQLEAVGLIAKTRKTIGVEKGSTVCNLYRFTDMPVNRRPDLGIESCRATHDYKAVDSLSMANRLVKTACAPTKKKTLQKLESSATDSVLARIFDAPYVAAPTTKTVATSQLHSSSLVN